jgi:hypothetical protein
MKLDRSQIRRCDWLRPGLCGFHRPTRTRYFLRRTTDSAARRSAVVHKPFGCSETVGGETAACERRARHDQRNWQDIGGIVYQLGVGRRSRASNG